MEPATGTPTGIFTQAPSEIDSTDMDTTQDSDDSGNTHQQQGTIIVIPGVSATGVWLIFSSILVFCCCFMCLMVWAIVVFIRKRDKDEKKQNQLQALQMISVDSGAGSPTSPSTETMPNKTDLMRIRSQSEAGHLSDSQVVDDGAIDASPALPEEHINCLFC